MAVLGASAFHFSPLDPIASDVLPNAPALTRRLEVMRGRLKGPHAGGGKYGRDDASAHRALRKPINGWSRCRRANALKPGDLVQRLAEAYHRTAIVSEPDFALRGDVVDVFPASGEPPFRLDFFGDELESIRGIDLD